jgi:hypothetical protein
MKCEGEAKEKRKFNFANIRSSSKCMSLTLLISERPILKHILNAMVADKGIQEDYKHPKCRNGRRMRTSDLADEILKTDWRRSLRNACNAAHHLAQSEKRCLLLASLVLSIAFFQSH